MSSFDELSDLRLLVNLMWLADPMIDKKDTTEIAPQQPDDRIRKAENGSEEGIGLLLQIFSMYDVLECMEEYKKFIKKPV